MTEFDPFEQPPTPDGMDDWVRLVRRLGFSRMQNRDDDRTTVTARDLQARVHYQISARYAYDILRETADRHDDECIVDDGTLLIDLTPGEPGADVEIQSSGDVVAVESD